MRSQKIIGLAIFGIVAFALASRRAEAAINYSPPPTWFPGAFDPPVIQPSPLEPPTIQPTPQFAPETETLDVWELWGTPPVYEQLQPAPQPVYEPAPATESYQPAQYITMSASPEANLSAILALIRKVESANQYNVIAGNDYFTDFSDHPFRINPKRRRPLGTTASGAYQMVIGTWDMAKSALGLTDFSPASQDAAAVWLLENKPPRGGATLARAGNFDGVINLKRKEWEAFDKMLLGTYPISMDQARQIYLSAGGGFAQGTLA